MLPGIWSLLYFFSLRTGTNCPETSNRDLGDECFCWTCWASTYKTDLLHLITVYIPGKAQCKVQRPNWNYQERCCLVALGREKKILKRLIIACFLSAYTTVNLGAFPRSGSSKEKEVFSTLSVKTQSLHKDRVELYFTERNEDSSSVFFSLILVLCSWAILVCNKQ